MRTPTRPVKSQSKVVEEGRDPDLDLLSNRLRNHLGVPDLTSSGNLKVVVSVTLRVRGRSQSTVEVVQGDVEGSSRTLRTRVQTGSGTRRGTRRRLCWSRTPKNRGG